MKVNYKYGLVILLFLLVALPARAQQHPPSLPGLSVRDGVLVLNGKPYRGIGANYYNLFCRTLQDTADKSYQNGLRRLAQAGIPFVRFSCGGFWPINWDLYLHDKHTYFRSLDEVVKTAENNEIGLIPSLFWHMPTVPDIMHERMDRLGDPNSKTVTFIRSYTEEVVTRYRNSPAIWGWEFGNEYNLRADLPNAKEHRPTVMPQFKTPRERTDHDDLSSRHMLVAFAEFAHTVRKHDKHRIIITGNSIPRPSAYHNTYEKNWTLDTKEQFARILLRDNPEPFDVISVHVYPDKNHRYAAGAKTLESLIRIVQSYSLQARKPLFIGEFGASAELSKENERALFTELISAIVANRVPLSAFWVFDLSKQKDWNVTFENDRAYMLQMVAEANVRLRATD
jgi:hypothetical protein